MNQIRRVSLAVPAVQETPWPSFVFLQLGVQQLMRLP